MNITIGILLTLLGFALAYYLYSSLRANKLQLNQLAPDFALFDQDSQMRRLSDYRGHRVVVYFYPKADTTGCTKEACSIRDGYATFKKNNIGVLGISYDAPKEQKAFHEKYHLPFLLLSDTSREVAKAYGAYQNAINILFPARKTFLINEEGRLIKIFDNVDVNHHATQILEAYGIREN